MTGDIVEMERVHSLMAAAGGRLAGRPDADEQVERLRSLRSGSEFRAYLAGLPELEGRDRRREVAIVASGPGWEAHRERLLRAAASRKFP